MEQLIRDWASERLILSGSSKHAQMLKLIEEVGELASAISKNKNQETVDAIGDCAVVLIIIAALHGLTLHQCLEIAYEQIKDRKGKMVNGVFVKE